MERYVTEMPIMQDLHADLYDGWLRSIPLWTLKAYTTFICRLKTDPDEQLMVFEQISNTRPLMFQEHLAEMGIETDLH